MKIFIKTCLSQIPMNNRYTINEGLTWQYMIRMDNSQRIELLRDIALNKVDTSIRQYSFFIVPQDRL